MDLFWKFLRPPPASASDVTTIPCFGGFGWHGAILAGGNQFRPNLNIATRGAVLATGLSPTRQAPALAIMTISPGGSCFSVAADLQAPSAMGRGKEPERCLSFVEDLWRPSGRPT